MMKDPSLVTEPALSLSKGHSSFSLKAPAKINWHLKVLGLRCDGFHEIKSLIQKITLYDILTFTKSKDLLLTTDPAIATEENLVYKAARLLKEECRVKEGASIELKKNIPLFAGLAGGSTDAAAALIGLNNLWRLRLSKQALHAFAQKLGSDVPFFLNGPLAMVEGRGETITPINVTGQYKFNILLIKPSLEVSTAWAYRNLPPEFKNKARLTKKGKEVDNIKFSINALNRLRDCTAKKNLMAGSLSNDLEAVVVKNYPVIDEIKERMLKEGAVFSMMSGSGSSVFGVFGSAKEAKMASSAFPGFWTTVVKTIT